MSMNAPLSADDIIQTGLQTAFAAISGARSSNPANLEYIGLKVQAAIDALQVVEAKVKARQIATEQAEECMGPRHEEMLRRTLGGMKLSGELERKVPRYEPQTAIGRALCDDSHQHPLPLPEFLEWKPGQTWKATVTACRSHIGNAGYETTGVETVLLVLERLGLIRVMNNT